jgi:hypothetical protein
VLCVVQLCVGEWIGGGWGGGGLLHNWFVFSHFDEKCMQLFCT